MNIKSSVSALSMAILSNSFDNAILLIENGSKAYFNSTDAEMDCSPIFLACEIQNPKLIEYMCDNGLSLEVRNS